MSLTMDEFYKGLRQLKQAGVDLWEDKITLRVSSEDWDSFLASEPSPDTAANGADLQFPGIDIEIIEGIEPTFVTEFITIRL